MSGETEWTDEVHRWLLHAREDLVAAEALAGTAQAVPRHACWLAQQAAEKALKAVLVFLQQDYPLRHDLDAIRNLIPEGWRIKEEYPDLAELTAWAIEARYPGAWPDPVSSDAAKAAEQARSVLESVLRDLEQHGFEPREAL